MPSYTVTRVGDSSTETFITSGLFLTLQTVGAEDTLYAMAVVVSSPVSTSPPVESTQITTPDATSNTSESHPTATTSASPASAQTAAGGLSAGAAAGLGVGVAVGTLILAAAAFFVYRRRRKERYPPTTAACDPQYAGVPQFQNVHSKADFPQPVEMGVYERPVELPN